MIRIAIIEDEEIHAKRLHNFCQQYAQESGEKIQAALFENGISFLEMYPGNFDAVFMDIAMPHMDGMECAQRLRKLDETVPLIFVTNMAQYAIKGYEVAAMDFMVKPIEYDEFALKMEKIQYILVHRGGAVVSVRQKNQTRMLKIQDITYVEIFNHDLLFHTRAEVLGTYGKLSSLEDDARFSGFVRCSQSHFVNCSYISAIGRESLLVNGEQIPIARRKKKACMEKIAAVLGRSGV